MKQTPCLQLREQWVGAEDGSGHPLQHSTARHGTAQHGTARHSSEVRSAPAGSDKHP